MSDSDWFAPKRFGYGAGMPIAWQGWAILIGYLAVLFGLERMIRAEHPAVFVTLVLIVTAALIVVAARHTRGGWRWRWRSGD